MTQDDNNKMALDPATFFIPPEQGWSDLVQRHLEYLQFYPNNHTAFYNLGLAFAKENMADNAERAFLKALEISPKMTEALINLGGLAYGRMDWDKTIEYNEKALEVIPDMAQSKLNIAFALLMKEENDKAADMFADVLMQDKKNGNAKYGLAIANEAMGNLEEARKLLEEAKSFGVTPSEDFEARLKA